MVKVMKNYEYIPFEILNGKNILITGACVLIGSASMDSVIENNVKVNL